MLQVLRRNADVGTLGLTGAVELRQILIKTADPSGRFHVKSRPNIGAALGESSALGVYEDQPAIIEFKAYSPDADAATVDQSTRRVCQLVALLSRPQSPEAGPSLRVLPCVGYYVEPGEARYSFIYKIPPSLDPNPITLLSCISAGERKYRSTIKHRFQLAHILAVSIYQLHRVGWVHKSFRSENVIFFPSGPGTGSTSGADESTVVPDAVINRQNKNVYVDPWLIGFEYARVLSQDSNLAASDTSIAKNVYRHPERWNAPTHKFGPIHDIYALGAVLLEIGLWRPLMMLSETGFERAADPEAATEVRESVKAQLVQNTVRKLPFTLGSVYCEVVQLCLTGDTGTEGFDVDVNDHMALNMALREKVVDRLAVLCAAI
jgi:serine/threonine protein kinase